MKVKKLIYEYDWYLKQTAGVSESTRRQYLRCTNHFLSEGLNNNISDKLCHLKPEDLIQYVIKQKKHHNMPVLKSMVRALRSFLKFLQLRGLCEAKLVKAVPTIAGWKLSGIPDYLTKEQLEEFLASFDKKSAVGRRDYAIALCLARLGLRRKEAAKITLDDIDWRSGNICITLSKSRRFSTFPLPQDVGKAITEYLLNGRPYTESRHVFVCHRLHIGKPLNSSAVGAVICRHFRRQGTNTPPKSAHILRHTVATLMVNNGISIKEIADFLGHKSLSSTAIYTKVNLTML
ncbi:MAG: site-specific integrase [Candidatus Humimicrobiaceae bacterium]